MTDWAQSGRRDRYRFFAVDPFSLMELQEIDCIPSECSITWGYYTDNKANADITVAEDSFAAMHGRLVRVTHTVTLPGGAEETETLGTFFVESAEKTTGAEFPTRRLNCYSTMWRMSKSALTSDHIWRAGDYCLAGLTRLMEGGGATVVPLEGADATRTHTMDGRFGVGDNRLQCATRYAGWCGWQIGVDDYGRQTIGAYVAPANRAPKTSFESGRNCVYLPSIKETGTGELYNEVVALWSRQSDPGDNLGLSGSAYTSLDSANPMAYENCGARLTGVLKLAEPCTAAELRSRADEYLAQHDASIRYLEIEHVGIPHLRAGDTVLYSNEAAGDANLLCEITQMDVSSLGPLMLTKSKLKVVGA